mmetsp:Transcript_89990/g.253822  ORF Transcript_89990/g.253822 Transcript_89990/m.253822 type:complete len:206 (-) Transcript_89990:670-1287(-)
MAPTSSAYGSSVPGARVQAGIWVYRGARSRFEVARHESRGTTCLAGNLSTRGRLAAFVAPLDQRPPGRSIAGVHATRIAAHRSVGHDARWRPPAPRGWMLAFSTGLSGTRLRLRARARRSSARFVRTPGVSCGTRPSRCTAPRGPGGGKGRSPKGQCCHPTGRGRPTIVARRARCTAPFRGHCRRPGRAHPAGLRGGRTRRTLSS